LGHSDDIQGSATYSLEVNVMSKMEYYQIQVMQLLGELDGGHRTSKDGAMLTQQFQEVVESYRNSENQQDDY